MDTSCDIDSSQIYTLQELRDNYPGGIIHPVGELPKLLPNGSLDPTWLQETIDTLYRYKVLPTLIAPKYPIFQKVPPLPSPPPPQPPKITPEWDASQGRVAGTLDIPKGDYTLSFDFTINSPCVGKFCNIIHVNNGQGDCCSPGTRSPAIWFWPNSTELHVILGDSTDGNWGLRNTDPLPLGRKLTFTLNAIGKDVSINVNNKTYNLTQPTVRPTGKNFKVHMNNTLIQPAYGPPPVKIQNLFYFVDGQKIKISKSANNNDTDDCGSAGFPISNGNALRLYEEDECKKTMGGVWKPWAMCYKDENMVATDSYSVKCAYLNNPTPSDAILKYQQDLTKYQNILQSIATSKQQYNDSARIFNQKNDAFKAAMKTEYCFYANRLYYIKHSFVKTNADPDVHGNDKMVNYKYELIKLNELKMLILRSIASKVYVNNISLIEGFQGSMPRSDSDLKRQHNTLTNEITASKLNNRMVDYTLEKNKANQNLLTLFGILNVVAIGIIYGIASS
jgi:hypothetical protein